MWKIIILFLCLSLTADEKIVKTVKSEDFKMNETGTNLELGTPKGNMLFFGTTSLGSNRHYRMSIPLDQLDSSFLKKVKEAPPPTNQPMVMAPTIVNMEGKDDDGRRRRRDDDDDEGEDKKKTEIKVDVIYDPTDGLILQANRLYNRRKYYEASMVVEQILAKRPTFARGWVMKGSLLYLQKQRDLAKKAWEQALTFEPNNTEIKSILERYQ